MTAHKCQGETLDEVIVDFGPDKEHNIRNYICPGSFYVAVTRVREGSKLFLRSFDKSYIAVNEKIEEKVNAMRKFNPYKMKKIYLDKRIFVDEEKELKRLENYEKNNQLNQYSKIYYNKIKKDIEIIEL